MRNMLNGDDEASSAGLGDESKMAYVRQLCDDIRSSLPDNFVTTDVRGRLQRIGALQPMNAFLRREIDRMQSIMSTVGASVDSLCEFVDGQAVRGDKLMDVFDAVYDARVPAAWTKVHSDCHMKLETKCVELAATQNCVTEREGESRKGLEGMGRDKIE